MKIIHLLKFLILISALCLNSFSESSENDKVIIDVTNIIQKKIEKAKWLKNSVARADLFNIPVMVAVFEEQKVDVSKTDGEDPAIFSRVIANNLIKKSLNNSFNKFDTFIVDTIFDEKVEEGKTDFYILRNYIAKVDNKRKPVFIVSTEILKKETYQRVGSDFQDSLLVAMRSDTVVKEIVPEKKKKKKSWFRRKKKKVINTVKADSTNLDSDTLINKDTLTEVFLGTDSVQTYNEEANKTKVLLLFIIIISVVLICLSLYLFRKK